MSTWIHSLAGHISWADAIMGGIAVYGAGAAILVLAAAWLRDREGFRACVAALAGAALALVASSAIGSVWDRPRPFVVGHFVPLIAHAADASFPSDHLAVLGAIAVGLWFGSRRLAVVTVFAALVVAFARVYVGVHYVSDVAGGFVLGVGCGAIAWWITGLLARPLHRIDEALGRAGLRPRVEGRRSEGSGAPRRF